VDEAHDAINLASFNTGKEYFKNEGADGQFRAYKQSPVWYDEKKKFRGDYINIWYRSDLNFNFDSLIEELRPDSLMMNALDVEVPKELRQ
jgi:hypothetical protein